MHELDLDAALSVVDCIRRSARAKKMKPLVIAVLDIRGEVKALAAEDNAALKRGEFAIAKAYGVMAMGMGPRSLAKRVRQKVGFAATTSEIIGRPLMEMPGSVLIRNRDGAIVGSVGVSGDSSQNDEVAAVAGVVAAGFVADLGEDGD